MRPLTRGERKSLALHRYVAARLTADPSAVDMVRRRLDWLRSKNPAGVRYYDEWARLLTGPREALLDVLVGSTDRARALRQESPFVDLVDQRERARIYRAVADEIDGIAAS